MARKQRERRIKGEGSYYQRPSGSWSYTIRLSNGKSRTVTARTMEALGDKVKDLRKELDAGLSDNHKLSTSEWLTYWLDQICVDRVKPRTLHGYRRYVDLYIRPKLGRYPLRALAPEHVRALYRWMADDRGLSTATIKQCHAILSRCLKVAQQEGKVLRNVAASVEPPQPTERGSHGTVTIAEAAAILDYLRGQDARMRARWVVALLAGLRQGEALGLDWKDVDLDERVIRVRQAQSRRDGEFVLVPPKSKRSLRDVPMADEVHDALAALREDAGGTGLVFGPKHVRNDYGEWQRVLKSVMIGEGDEAKCLPPRSVHACRSATASILTAANVPPRVVADILGHANPVVTETHYIVTGMDTRRAGMMDGMKLLEKATKQLEKKDAP